MSESVILSSQNLNKELNTSKLEKTSVENLNAIELTNVSSECQQDSPFDLEELDTGFMEKIQIVTNFRGQSQVISIPVNLIPVSLQFEILTLALKTQEKNSLPANNLENTTENFLQDISGLTIRELEILDLLSEGLLYKEIAQRLKISALTVKNHLRNIYLKLKVSNRSEAIVKYLGHTSIISCRCKQKFNL